MTKLIDDVYSLIKHETNSLTTKDLEKLSKLVEFVIIDAIVEAKLNATDIAEIDVGLGTLYIKCDSDVKTKLVLNDSLKSRINECLKLDASDLDAKLNDAIVARITHIYKDLIL